MIFTLVTLSILAFCIFLRVKMLYFIKAHEIKSTIKDLEFWSTLQSNITVAVVGKNKVLVENFNLV